MKGGFQKKLDRKLAQKRWNERFTWKAGDIKIVKRGGRWSPELKRLPALHLGLEQRMKPLTTN